MCSFVFRPFALQLLQTDIDSHKPSVASANESAAELIKECDPKMARNIQGRLDNLNSRFEKVIVRARERRDSLQSLLDRLLQLLEAIGDLEDWMLPVIDSLESRELVRLDLPDMGGRLQVFPPSPFATLIGKQVLARRYICCL